MKTEDRTSKAFISLEYVSKNSCEWEMSAKIAANGSHFCKTAANETLRILLLLLLKNCFITAN